MADRAGCRLTHSRLRIPRELARVHPRARWCSSEDVLPPALLVLAQPTSGLQTCLLDFIVSVVCSMRSSFRFQNGASVANEDVDGTHRTRDHRSCISVMPKYALMLVQADQSQYGFRHLYTGGAGQAFVVV